jgi:hypothetical protein
MTRENRAVAVGNGFFSPLVVIVIGGILLSGCTDFKRMVGIEKTPPDEFAVESRAPLTIPPDFNLRPPQPGAARPQEISAADRARGVVDSAGPGEPGKQATGSLRYPGSEPQIDPNAQLADQSLSLKLLQSPDTGGSVVVEKRETTTLKGVY